MDKVKEMESSYSHGVSIAERKNILVTGVKRIDSFDNEEEIIIFMYNNCIFGIDN